MARYEGHDDYKAEEAELRALSQQRQELAAREIARRREVERTAPLVDEATRAERQLGRARREARDVKIREQSVQDVDTRGLKANTDEIERNARARQRATRAAVDFSQALRGGRDPMFAQAHAMAQANQGQISQYAMRRDLPGVGQRRAASMQAAIQAGMVPGTGAEARQPLTRAQAARLGVEQSEADLAAANRELQRVRRRQSATDYERLTAAEGQQDARRQRDVARRELATAETAEQASRERASAERELARTRRLEAAEAARPGTELIRHPTEFGRRLPGPMGPLGMQIRTGTGEPYLGQGVRAEPNAQQRSAAANATASAQQAQAAAMAQAAAQAQREAEAMARFEEANFRANVSAEAMTAAQGRVRAATRDSAVEFGTVSQQMTRHGALTSEFITAAARGEVTMRELGNQAVVTAGKFGGWTAAATALFGAASAIQRVGQGAMDASSGVHVLQRVITTEFDPGEAQQQFASMAQEFNVPIATVVDAVYRMGQRFHNLPDAVEAARSSLYSFKTGEVDVAQSTDSLLAIVNGFGLGASQLTTVFDQINQAQNVFGIRIGETEAGLARAGGTWKNAGGDLDTLLALFVSISRATGESGSTIGTGLLRSVNQLRQPANQQLLAQQGIEVDPQNVQETFRRAMTAARQPGADVNLIARGLLGTQYFRLLAPVLRDQRTFNQALADTSPEESKRSAQNELAKVLQQADERVKALGIDLETLGAALAEAGVFTIPGIFLNGLDMALDLINSLINAFNAVVPPDLRPMVSSLAEAAAAIAIIRRFGGFERLAQRNPAFLPLVNQDRRIQIRATRGLRDQAEQAMNYQEGLARREFQQRIEVEATRTRAQQFEDTYQRRSRAGTLPDPGSEARIRLEQERAHLNEQFLGAERAANSTAAQVNSAKQVAIAAERELAALQALHHREVRSFLQQRGVTVPAELGTPNLRGIASVPGGTAWPVPYGIQQTARGMQQYSAPIGPTQQTARGQQQYNIPALPGSPQGRRERGIWRVRETLANIVQRDAREVNALGRSYALTERAALAANAGATRLRTHTSGVTGALGRTAGSMRTTMSGLLSGFGVFDYALIAWMAGNEIIDRILEHQKRQVDAATRRATAEQGTTGEMRKAMAEAEAEARRRLAEGDTGPEAQVAADTANRLQTTLDAQRKAPITSGRHNYLLAQDTITRQAQGIRRRFEDGEATQFMLDSAIQTAIQDVRGSVVIPNKDRGAVISALANMTSNRRVQQAALRQLNEEQQKAANEAAVSQAQVFGGTPANMSRIVDSYRAMMGRYEGKTDDASIKELNQLRLDFYQSVEQQVQADLDYGLAGAQTEGQRRAAYARALTGYRQSLVRPASQRVDRANRGLAAARERQQRADLALAAAQAGQAPTSEAPGAIGGGVIAGLPSMDLTALRAAATKAKADVDRLKGERDSANEEYKAAMRVYRGKKLEIRRAEFEDRQQGREVTAGLETARTPDQQQQAQIALGAAEANLRDARRSGFGPRSREYQGALRAVFEARTQVAQAVASHVEAENSLVEAQAGSDPVSQANAALQSARNTMATMRDPRYRNRFSDDDRTKAQADVIRARNQRDETVRNEAIEEQRLQDQIAVAQAGGDTMLAARRAQAAARRALASARTRKERLQAQLDVATADNDLADAQQEQASLQDQIAVARAGGDPVLAAHRAQAAARRALGSARGRTQRLQAQLAMATADNDLANAQQEQARLQDQIAVARAGGDPVLAARRAQAAARRALSRARGRTQRLQALLELVTANNQYQDALEDQEAARAEYLQTTTTDPVEQARRAERQANRNVKGTHGAERYRALAARNQARQARLDAELAGKEDDIEFERDMGRMSIQGAISRYQELLNIRTLTKAQRRDIQRRIKALQDEGDQEASGFDLDVGSIKLPTVYDVRKAWDPVRDQIRRQAGDHRQAGRDQAMQRQSMADMDTGRVATGDIANTPTTSANFVINVYDKSAAPEVYAQIDRALRTRVRAKMRSKGKRG